MEQKLYHSSFLEKKKIYQQLLKQYSLLHTYIKNTTERKGKKSKVGK